MKKIIMAAAALTAGIVMADDSIVSSTVVGYQKRSMLDEDGQLMESYSGGPVFKAIGSKGNTYTLNDFTASGMDTSLDGIQFLDPDTTETYLTATYADANTYKEAWVGWWDAEDVGGARLDGPTADTYPACTAFLALFASDGKIEFMFSGEGEKGTKTVKMSTESPFIYNPQPVDLTLENVTAEGMDTSQDGFQFLDPYTTETVLTVTYANAKDYGESWKGWWDSEDVGGTRVDDTKLPSGQGLLGMIASGNEITLTFDAVLAE